MAETGQSAPDPREAVVVEAAAESLDTLLDALSVAVVDTGRPQVLLARDAGLSQKHVSQMLTGRADGSLRAWQALLDAAGLFVHVIVHATATGQDTTDPADGPTEAWWVYHDAILRRADPADELTEDDLWEQLWETDAARSCSCPSCNYYALDYEDHKDEPCILLTLIERIIAARQRLTTQADHTEATP